VAAAAIAAGQGDMSDREFIKNLKERIAAIQRALDLALKDMHPSLSRSPARMRELLQRPTNDYEAAACAHNHREHLKAAALSLHSLHTTIPVQDLQAFNKACGPHRKTTSARRPDSLTSAKEPRAPPVKSKKRGRTSNSPSADSPDQPIRKKHKTAAASTKGRRKA